MADAKINSKVDIDITIDLKLSLLEARALKEIVAFGTDAFMKVFKEKLGNFANTENEKGLASLVNTLKDTLPYRLTEADKIIKTINELKTK